MAKKISTGIDIGTHTTRVVVMEWSKDNQYPEVIGTGNAPTNGMRLGYVTNPKEVAKGIKKAVEMAEKTAKIKIRRAYVSMGGISLSSVVSTGTTTITKADKEVTHLDVSNVVADSQENLDILNRKIISVVPIEYKLDGNEIHGRPEGMKGLRLEVKTLFVTCLKQNLEDLATAFTEANIDIVDVVASPLASSLVLLSEKQKIAGCALLDIGAETVSLAVFENGTLLSVQVFSIGGMDITKDVALGFRINLDEAESVKVGSVLGDYPKKKVDEIIEARLDDVFELVENHLKQLKRNGLLPAGVIITGGGSHINKIDEIAKSQLKIPASLGPMDTSVNARYKIRDSSWYKAVGLALCQDNSNNESLGNSIGDNFKQAKGLFKSLFSQLLP